MNELQKLKGCRVIEGYLRIVLIDKANTSSYDGIVFPDLVEITGYLVLYR